MAASPSKTLKGMKMPGRLGGRQATAQNLALVRIDNDRGVLLIKGAVPGRRGASVLVRTAKKKGAAR